MKDTKQCPYCSNFCLMDSDACSCGYYFDKEEYEEIKRIGKSKGFDQGKESAHVLLIALGYILTASGGVLGLIVGIHLAFSKNRRNTPKTYRYSDRSRNHGLVIIALATVLLSIGIVQILK